MLCTEPSEHIGWHRLLIQPIFINKYAGFGAVAPSGVRAAAHIQPLPEGKGFGVLARMPR